jgi:hypothetical protein
VVRRGEESRERTRMTEDGIIVGGILYNVVLFKRGEVCCNSRKFMKLSKY